MTKDRLLCRSPGGDLGAKKKKKKQKRKKEKPSSGGTKSDSASDSQELKVPSVAFLPVMNCYFLFLELITQSMTCYSVCNLLHTV